MNNSLGSRTRRRSLLRLVALCLSALATAPLHGAITTQGDVSLPVGGQGSAMIGATAPGIVAIDGGSQLGVSNLRMGETLGGVGLVEIAGFGSQLNSLGSGNRIGVSGIGKISVVDGGRLGSTGEVTLGDNSSGYGEVVVRGFGSTWMGANNQFALNVGGSGQGVVIVENGGRVQTATLAIAAQQRSPGGPQGRVTLRGAGTSWENQGQLSIGQRGDGELEVLDGALFKTGGGQVVIGASSSLARGSLLVAGEDSRLTFDGQIYVGSEGSGALRVADGGAVESSQGQLRVRSYGAAQGSVEVVGPGSRFSTAGPISLEGNSSLAIRDGGMVSATYLTTTGLNGPDGSIMVDGPGSLLSLYSSLTFGSAQPAPTEIVVSHGGCIQLGASQGIMQLFNNTLRLDGGSIGDASAYSSLSSDGLVTGNGEIDLRLNNDKLGRVEVGPGQRLSIGGTISNFGQIMVNGGALDAGGPVMNNRMMRLNNAELRVGGAEPALHVSSGGQLELGGQHVRLDADVTTSTGGAAVLGAGLQAHFERSLVNASALTLLPEAAATIDGSFRQEGSGITTIGLTADDLTPSRAPLEISGEASLNGLLNVYFADAYQPTYGEVFPVLTTAASVRGRFSQTQLPSLNPGLSWLVEYDDPHAVTLRVIGQYGSDFNADGLVSGGDLAAWQSGFGHDGMTHAAGDANGDGTVNGSDFLNWQRGYRSTTAATSAAVPEPTALLLALVAGCASIRRRTFGVRL